MKIRTKKMIDEQKVNSYLIRLYTADDDEIGGIAYATVRHNNGEYNYWFFIYRLPESIWDIFNNAPESFTDEELEEGGEELIIDGETIIKAA